MSENRPYILTIAGFDPTNGAGLTADIKTFEQNKTYGLSVCTSITLQTEDQFLGVRWEKLEDILEAMKVLLAKYPVQVVKTGILPNLTYFEGIIQFLKINYPTIKIIVDPIFKASAGFDLFDFSSKELFYNLLKECYLITPNLDEVKWITGQSDNEIAVEELAKFCSVYLKGGHSLDKKGFDYLYENIVVTEFPPSKESTFSKHGTGCILSAAIASNLALDFPLNESCRRAKLYLEKILESNHTLLAYHNV
ncbi:MAG: hydroxymethylpyrimidine/phosphomethylpyrimidine kinase [Flavobacteriia bacterium]|nr:hydroxymethylpyrimidine/phosphomethylpyrimidine kinase [Flavobacteriia bacterium]